MTKRTSTRASSNRTASRKATRKATPAKSKTKKAVVKRVTTAKKAATRSTTVPKRRAAGSARTVSPKTETPKKLKGTKSTTKRVKAPKIKVVKRTAGSKRASRPEPLRAASQDRTQPPDEHRPVPKTHLSDEELQEFEKLLLRKRRELAVDVIHLTRDAIDRKEQVFSKHSAMPIHMADLGSDNWEKEFTLGLIASEQALVQEIDNALARIESRTYGICLATHKRISKARLRAKPWAKYCIKYALAREEGCAP